ncbi:MAG: glycosyltransferase family A protein [Lysobacterales bacterium]|jgi:GT2 family glycosyltransferase
MADRKPLPTVSVIVPAFNAGADLERCLAAIGRSDTGVTECIVVDDASTDGSAKSAAARHGARLLRLECQSGPAVARNLGAASASGEVLMFVDADVLLHEGAIRRALEELAAAPDVAAVFGSYDEQPDHSSFLSQYRNLYHHWNHQVGSPEASTFWSGCGAVRRSAFESVGGYSADFGAPSIEDVEMGYRLRAAGFRIRLVRDMLATHLKRWTFRDMVRTDLFRRAIPWVVLLQRFPDAPPDLNINWRARIATAAAGLLALSLLLLLPSHSRAILPFLAALLVCLGCVAAADRAGRSGRGLAGAGLLAVTLLVVLPATAWALAPTPQAALPLGLAMLVALTQWGFLVFLAGHRGLVFMLATIPLLLLFFLSCALAVPLGLLKSRFGDNKKRETDT